MGVKIVGVVALGMGLAIVFFAVRVVKKAHKQSDEERRYAFEHMTEGGVVEHESYDTMKAAKRKSAGNMLAGGCGLWAALGGIVLALLGYVMIFHLPTG